MPVPAGEALVTARLDSNQFDLGLARMEGGLEKVALRLTSFIGVTRLAFTGAAASIASANVETAQLSGSALKAYEAQLKYTGAIEDLLHSIPLVGSAMGELYEMAGPKRGLEEMIEAIKQVESALKSMEENARKWARETALERAKFAGDSVKVALLEQGYSAEDWQARVAEAEKNRMAAADALAKQQAREQDARTRAAEYGRDFELPWTTQKGLNAAADREAVVTADLRDKLEREERALASIRKSAADAAENDRARVAKAAQDAAEKEKEAEKDLENFLQEASAHRAQLQKEAVQQEERDTRDREAAARETQRLEDRLAGPGQRARESAFQSETEKRIQKDPAAMAAALAQQVATMRANLEAFGQQIREGRAAGADTGFVEAEFEERDRELQKMEQFQSQAQRAVGKASSSIFGGPATFSPYALWGLAGMGGGNDQLTDPAKATAKYTERTARAVENLVLRFD